MIIKVYQSEIDKYVEMQVIAKYKYIGENWGVSLTNGKIYNCVGYDEDGLLRIVDDTDEDYLYSKRDFELIEEY